MFYLYQSDDERVTAVAVGLLNVQPEAEWLGQPLADGEPLPRRLAEKFVERHGGLIIDADGVRRVDPEG